MHSLTLLLHLITAGIWLGCVLSETLFERALLGQGHAQERILAELHKRVDLFIEVPAFVAVLVSGTLMLDGAMLTPLLLAKIALGLLAIVTNSYCVWLVLRRATAAHQNEWPAFSRFDRRQHQFGAVVLTTIVMSLMVGSYHWVYP